MSTTLVFSEEVVAEILSWIPVKALMRFRCVSKPWNSLIFTPTFIKLHFQRSPKNTRVLIDANTFVSSCSLPDLFEDPSSVIHHSCQLVESSHSVLMVCKGLVCMLTLNYKYRKFHEFWARFWNPATRLMSEETTRYQIYENFDCFDLRYRRFGFGYDDRRDSFDMVLLILACNYQETEVTVFSVGDNCWKLMFSFFEYDCPIGGDEPIGEFVSGTINWLVTVPPWSSHHHRKTDDDTMNQIKIFSFDMKNETYKYMPMPIPIDSEPNLGVLKDCLCFYHDYMKTHFVVWLMREFGVDKSWTQLLNINYEHLQIYGPYHKETLCMPLCMSEDEDVMLLKNCVDHNLVVYNKRDNGIRLEEDVKLRSCAAYVPSLFLPY
ncbi:F-box/kelch-repeat protein At3g23880 [Cajanus cajan]|nr:F-box/kelch-repeat protein At3g23880 [Cajanus cajan]